jgi:hypothetical protein
METNDQTPDEFPSDVRNKLGEILRRKTKETSQQIKEEMDLTGKTPGQIEEEERKKHGIRPAEEIDKLN